jgi:hypothetical protein
MTITLDEVLIVLSDTTLGTKRDHHTALVSQTEKKKEKKKEAAVMVAIVLVMVMVMPDWWMMLSLLDL